MPITLDDVPAKLTPPGPPGKRRWVVITLLCAALGSGLVVLFWPAHLQRGSLWYWCCVAVLPATVGLLGLALRGLMYERQRDYAQRWNQQRLDHLHRLTQQGQRAVGLLASAYCTPAGSRQLAGALRRGSAPQKPVYLGASRGVSRCSQLVPVAQQHTANEYQQRLRCFMRQVLATLQQDLDQVTRLGRLRVRIRHDSTLPDAALLAAWRACVTHDAQREEVHFATQDDGLLWLDQWLDTPDGPGAVLSLEINVFKHPVDTQCESVSAVLLALPEFCHKYALKPQAWVHRPAMMLEGGSPWSAVMRWGRMEDPSETYFIWQLQLCTDQLASMNLEMAKAGRSIDRQQCLHLDGVLGRPAEAVGNIGIIVAGEQAVTDAQPQLVVIQDQTVHGVVVRPVARRQGE